MRRTLEDLWYGNISPQDKKIHRGTAYDDALSAMCKNGDKLEKLLEGKEKETFEKFCGAQDEVHDLENLEYFIEGFRLGAKLITDMPCIIRNLTDEQAITQMVEDNTTQRENILPSEKAKALKMQLDAIKRQGARDGNAGQRSDEIVAERNKMTGKQVQRYIKLNYLVPELMKMTDEGTLKFTPALELAFISRKHQQYIALAIDAQQSSPNLSQAQRLRNFL